MTLQKNISTPFLLLMALLMLFKGCYKEVLIEEIDIQESPGLFSINHIDAMYDLYDRTFMFTIGSDTLPSFTPYIHFSSYLSMRFEGKELINDQLNDLGDIRINQVYQILATRNDAVDTFKVLFTPLPLMHIKTNALIVDEPKVWANITLQYCNEEDADPLTYHFRSLGGVEFRGASALNYKKKSYGLEFRTDEKGDDFVLSLLGMRPCSDWMLDAMYIDDLRMRNRISFELWEKMCSVSEEEFEAYHFQGIHSKYVELFINNDYHGLYSFGEKLDENLLQFSDNQYQQGGVLYKAIRWGVDGATKFQSYNEEPTDDEFWDGWKLIYPTIDTAWNALKTLRKLIVYGNDDDFENEIASLIDLDNAMNYYLFLNLLSAFDNAGKNTFLVKYTSQTPFSIIPWDLEASWGLAYTREKTNSTSLLSNHLYDRLIETNTENFVIKHKELWFAYRENVFSEEALMQPIDDYYHLMKKSGAIEREKVRWKEYPVDIDAEYAFIQNWIKERLLFLDDYFMEN